MRKLSLQVRLLGGRCTWSKIVVNMCTQMVLSGLRRNVWNVKMKIFSCGAHDGRIW